MLLIYFDVYLLKRFESKASVFSLLTVG